MSVLSFNEGAHQYRWGGQPVPSVTQCLARLHDFSMVPKDVLDAACERGTIVHKLCEYHDLRDLDASSIGDFHPYLDAWIDFCADRKTEWEGIEWQGYSERFGFAGTMDRYGRVGGVPYIIDIKTSQQPHPVWGLQTAAYRQLLAEKVGTTWALANRATVQLGANGKYRFVPWTDPADWPTFQALITLNNWSSKHA